MLRVPQIFYSGHLCDYFVLRIQDFWSARAEESPMIYKRLDPLKWNLYLAVTIDVVYVGLRNELHLTKDRHRWFEIFWEYFLRVSTQSCISRYWGGKATSQSGSWTRKFLKSPIFYWFSQHRSCRIKRVTENSGRLRMPAESTGEV